MTIFITMMMMRSLSIIITSVILDFPTEKLLLLVFPVVVIVMVVVFVRVLTLPRRREQVSELFA